MWRHSSSTDDMNDPVTTSYVNGTSQSRLDKTNTTEIRIEMLPSKLRDNTEIIID